ncbi:MAG: DNA-formamidopyrimidine glycosylase family protein [bacterium]|nr:DNA-formamidopyrimidine glycosylase family protein [bacterium]
MIELPESNVIAAQITEYLKGKVIDEIEVGHSPHKFAFYKGEPEEYEDLLEGKTIKRAIHRGGLIEIQTEDSMMFLGDGAYPRYYKDPKKFPKKHQFMMKFEDGTEMAVSIQMYGEIGVFPLGECEEGYYLSSLSKPDPLSDGFTYEYFRKLYIGQKKISAKSFLATEQRIPGLGNGVLQDILWEAGIDPRFPMSKASEEDFHTLYEAVRKILKKMVRDGARDTEKDLFGKKGGYITQLSKNSVYEPCMKCGNEIHKASYMGGTIYVCEHCQKR